jgi:hypothetical protein
MASLNVKVLPGFSWGDAAHRAHSKVDDAHHQEVASVHFELKGKYHCYYYLLLRNTYIGSHKEWVLQILSIEFQEVCGIVLLRKSEHSFKNVVLYKILQTMEHFVVIFTFFYKRLIKNMKILLLSGFLQNTKNLKLFLSHHLKAL